MSALALLLGITSGFILIGYHESPATLLMTSLAVDASLAPITTIVAIQRKRSFVTWAILGFAFGVWALAWILLFGGRPSRPTEQEPPTTPEAA